MMRPGKVVLKQHYVTPSEVLLPVHRQPTQKLHQAVPINLISRHLSQKSSTQLDNGGGHPSHSSSGTGKTELDGFYLLETAGISFPEDLQYVVLSGKGLRSVVEEDLLYFTELLYVDASENSLTLQSFGIIPRLCELRLTCNGLSTIGELTGFYCLQYLDLSYNHLTDLDIMDLTVLPRLKELNLSGNDLRGMPPDMSQFSYLEKLILEHNRLDDNSHFYAFGTIPQLRSLALAYNYFSCIPKDAVARDGFRLLEELDIAYNYFPKEDSVAVIMFMPRLLKIALYGNPLLGPTGEDALFIYIEDLVEKCSQQRDTTGSSLPDIEFLTEIPRKRLLKKGQPLGRFALYRDFCMVQVEDKKPLPAREFKKRSAFSEMMINRRALTPSASAGQMPDYTFITNSIATGNLAGMQKSSSHAQLAHSSGLNEQAMDALADSVMQQVADEMGLVGTEDLQLFAQCVALPQSVVNKAKEAQAKELEEKSHQRRKLYDALDELMAIENNELAGSEDRTIQEEDQEDTFAYGDAPRTPMSRASTAQSVPRETSLLRPDRIPMSLFGANINDTPALTMQPIAIKTAMKALQQAISQPLTNYNEIPSSWSLSGQGHAKQTVSSKNRQKARIPLKVSLTDELLQEEQMADKISGRLHRRGLPEPLAVEQLRQENHYRTLGQINDVLQQLNGSAQRISQDVQPLASDGLMTSPLAPYGRPAVNTIDAYGRPRSGVSTLLQMVQTMETEFQDSTR